MTARPDEVSKDRWDVPGSPSRRSEQSPASLSPQAGKSPAGFPADPFEPLTERGVSREVWESQGIVHYFGRKHTIHDPDAFRAELDGYGMTRGQRTTLVTFANGARGKKPDSHGDGDGLLMHKHPFPGEPSILPQLRPRHAVKTGSKTTHDHAKAFAGNPRGLERHLNDSLSGHKSIDLAGVHVHDNFGKYLVTPAANEPTGTTTRPIPRSRARRDGRSYALTFEPSTAALAAVGRALAATTCRESTRGVAGRTDRTSLTAST
jgi:hypothetical protein